MPYAEPRPRRPFRIRRPKPTRRRGRAKPKAVEVSDRNRKLIPGYGDRFYVTSRGRLYSWCHRLQIVDDDLRVQVIRPQRSFRLPSLVASLFGLKPPSYGGSWVAWVDPDGPIDPLTGQLRCSIADIVYVSQSELVAYRMSGCDPKMKPKNKIPVI